MWSSLVEALRRRRAPPHVRLAEAGLAKGMKVVDVGAGYGFFAFPAAEIVGEEGKVYAVEPNPRRAEEISKRAGERGVNNLEVLVTGAEDLSAMPDGSVDIAISMASFHHFSEAEKALAEIGRVVKPGGSVYIRDIKAGKVFKHGSDDAEFRRAVCKRFPSAEFEEGSGYLVAKIKR